MCVGGGGVCACVWGCRCGCFVGVALLRKALSTLEVMKTLILVSVFFC